MKTRRLLSLVMAIVMLLGMNLAGYADSSNELETTRRKLIGTWVWDGEASKATDGQTYESDIKSIVFKELEDKTDVMYDSLSDLSAKLFGLLGTAELNDAGHGFFLKYCPSSLENIAEGDRFSNFYFYDKKVTNPAYYLTEVTCDRVFGKDMDHLESSTVSAFLLEEDSLMISFSYSNGKQAHRVDFMFHPEGYKVKPSGAAESVTTAEKSDGYLGTLEGHWSEEKVHISGNSQSTHGYMLNNSVENCYTLTVSFAVTEYTGNPFDDYTLYARDLSGKWNAVGYFNVDKDSVNNLVSHRLDFDPEISFDAFAIIKRRVYSDYSLSYYVSFDECRVRTS